MQCNFHIQGPTMAELVSNPHPRVQAWLDRVRERCGEPYAQAHSMLRR